MFLCARSPSSSSIHPPIDCRLMFHPRAACLPACLFFIFFPRVISQSPTDRHLLSNLECRRTTFDCLFGGSRSNSSSSGRSRSGKQAISQPVGRERSHGLSVNVTFYTGPTSSLLEREIWNALRGLYYVHDEPPKGWRWREVRRTINLIMISATDMLHEEMTRINDSIPKR